MTYNILYGTFLDNHGLSFEFTLLQLYVVILHRHMWFYDLTHGWLHGIEDFLLNIWIDNIWLMHVMEGKDA
jgi:hypothetical protein